MSLPLYRRSARRRLRYVAGARARAARSRRRQRVARTRQGRARAIVGRPHGGMAVVASAAGRRSGAAGDVRRRRGQGDLGAAVRQGALPLRAVRAGRPAARACRLQPPSCSRPPPPAMVCRSGSTVFGSSASRCRRCCTRQSIPSRVSATGATNSKSRRTCRCSGCSFATAAGWSRWCRRRSEWRRLGRPRLGGRGMTQHNNECGIASRVGSALRLTQLRARDHPHEYGQADSFFLRRLSKLITPNSRMRLRSGVSMTLSMCCASRIATPRNTAPGP